ncbi:MAG: type II toxin-antitoxin system Phd/YefM family antitoxin [Gammaproteobacteria bacterium]|nr:type II toxin-antitoxin system Phd/YefM family antitoxin [Gammaproteobacteria bacterium]
MLEISVTQAQKQFSKIINKPAMIVDKKKSLKKAVILPYEVYCDLLNQSISKASLSTGGFIDFVGVLDKGFKTDNIKYQKIVK